MINRNALKNLGNWHKKKNRKPLIIRGARQTGKTTIVNMFAKNFKQYIYLNLEKTEDKQLFEQNLSFNKLLEAIYFHKEANKKVKETLIFIDEIQNSNNAIITLRYFYEEAPFIPVIAAGSLLEIYLEKYKQSFPVGRVEYLYLYPLNFLEYLSAINNDKLINTYNSIPIPEYSQAKLLEIFHEYILIGGMPAVCADYLENKDLNSLASIYESLIVSYSDDAAKYARNNTMYHILKHAIETAPLESGNRIKFQGFGNSNYKSREMGEVLRTLERVMLLYLIYPITSSSIPLLPNLKKSPKLLYLDSGLMNYHGNLQKSIIGVNDLNSLYKGKITEQIIGQELISITNNTHRKPFFWVREKSGTSSEIDYILFYKTKIIPLEIKSGKTGTLKSLHFFMEHINHDIAVRLYSGKLSIEKLTTPGGKKFRLLNLPYFLCNKIYEYIDWMES